MCITEEEDKAVDSFRRELAGYAFVDSYNKMFARYGLAAEFDEVRRLWKLGKRDEAAKAISEASCRKIAVFGNARPAAISSRDSAPPASPIPWYFRSARPQRRARLSEHDARTSRSVGATALCS